MNGTRRPVIVRVLLIVLLLEALLVGTALGYLVVELVIDTPTSLPTAIALTALTALAFIWVVAILIGVWRGAGWARSGGVVWQILQFAVGVGAIQGSLAQPAWGWPLIAGSILGIVLLLSRQVAEWLRRRTS